MNNKVRQVDDRVTASFIIPQILTFSLKFVKSIVLIFLGGVGGTYYWKCGCSKMQNPKIHTMSSGKENTKLALNCIDGSVLDL